MLELKHVLRKRLGNEVQAYMDVRDIPAKKFVELVNQRQGMVPGLSKVAPLTHRAIEGILGTASGHANTILQLRHFLLKNLRCPTLLLDPDNNHVQMARAHMAAQGLLHQSPEQVRAHSGTYFVHSSEPILHKMAVFVVLDHDPRINALLARASVIYYCNRSLLLHKTSFFSVRALHGYAYATSTHIYVHLHDRFQSAPYTILMEPAAWPNGPYSNVSELEKERHRSLPVYFPARGMSDVRLLFPDAFWSAVARKLTSQGKPLPKQPFQFYRASRVPSVLSRDSIMTLSLGRPFIPLYGDIDDYHDAGYEIDYVTNLSYNNLNAEK